MVTSVDSLEPYALPRPRADQLMETSADSLEPHPSEVRPQEDSLLEEGTSGGNQSQDTQAVLTNESAATFQVGTFMLFHDFCT